MPQRKKRAARYIRESDPNLLDSNTIDSQAKYVYEHCLKQGYDCNPLHEFREALSGYTIPYLRRPKLLAMLEAAKRKEFDVLVVSEIRAISRRQVEVFVIYDMLQKYGVELETVQEKFEDSAMGRLLLSLRAAFSEIEREQIYARLERGKKHRLSEGAPNGHPKTAYGYKLIDTQREVKAVYELNHTIIYVDDEGNQWSEYKVCMFIIDQVLAHTSLRSVATQLNDIGVPPPRKAIKHTPHWDSSAIYRMMSNPLYIGEVWANRFKKVDGKMVRSPKSDWVRVGDAPPLMDIETFDALQKQFAINKQDSMRNNRHGDEVGLLRSGFIFCGICGRRMSVEYAPKTQKGQTPLYRCYRKPGNNHPHNHCVTIHVPQLDADVWQQTVKKLQEPDFVRQRIADLRKETKSTIDVEVVEDTIATIQNQMDNLFALAKHATTDTTISQLGKMMEDLEHQRQQAQALLDSQEKDDEEKEALEREIVKFEKWVHDVLPFFTDPTYQVTYAEKRLAIRILGVHCSVYPTKGDHPYRYHVTFTVPDVLEKAKRIVLPLTVG